MNSADYVDKPEKKKKKKARIDHRRETPRNQ